jgi:cyanophycinase-like exopeptidase
MAGSVGMLVLIGSGETGPQMARVQREVVRRLADGVAKGRQPRAVVLDTPYGFQSNADQTSADLVDFLSSRLGLATTVASMRRADGDALERERAYEHVRHADFIFSGPGSPTYALRHWAPTDMQRALLEALAGGAAVVMASAAAMTLGRLTLPVYEIYKGGEDPRWLTGLDLLAQLGFGPVGLVTHWDNAEGGGHDTRYCFVGRRRLLALEAQLPEDAYILGIDEHTALVADLGQGRATVRGNGAVTLRRAGRERRLEAGEEIDLSDLGDATERGDVAGRGDLPDIHSGRAADPGAEPSDVEHLVRELLSLDGPELRSGIVRLGGVASQALASQNELVPALIAALVEVRDRARSSGDYQTADLIRARLREIGVELADAEDGTRSRLAG